MSRPRGGSANNARSNKISIPRHNAIQKRPVFHHFPKKRVPIRNFRESTPEQSTNIPESSVTTRDGKVLSKDEIQDYLRKQADKLVFRLENNSKEIEKDLPNNVLAFYAKMNAKEDEVVEVVPTVTISDEDASTLARISEEVEDGEIIEIIQHKPVEADDNEIVFVEYKRSNPSDDDVLIISDSKTMESLRVETNVEIPTGMPSTNKKKKSSKHRSTNAADIGWSRFDEKLTDAKNNNGKNTSQVMSPQNLTGKKLVVKRHWKTATIRISRNAPMPLMTYNNYLDSLSQFLARHRKIHCRGPEIMPHLSHPLIAKDNRFFFRFVTYNMLCQKSMDDNQYLYPQIPDYDSHDMWNARWGLLRHELMAMNSDIYFLQEVESEFFDSCYKPLFKIMKMDGFFTKRSTKADGCAIFWKENIFELVEQIPIDLNFGIFGLDKPNVAQIAILKHRHTGRIIMCVNTHILFSPKRGDIKLNQLMVIFSYMQQHLSKVHHYIFAGDFNIEPHSPLYNFIRNKSVVIKPKNPSFYNSTLSGQLRRPTGDALKHFCIPGKIGVNCNVQNDETFITKSDRVEHSLNFANVYDHTSRFGKPEVSSHHKDTGNPDHIFYSVNQVINHQDNTYEVYENGLHLVRRLSLPDEIFMNDHVGKLPNTATGSDHLPLLAEFIFY